MAAGLECVQVQIKIRHEAKDALVCRQPAQKPAFADHVQPLVADRAKPADRAVAIKQQQAGGRNLAADGIVDRRQGSAGIKIKPPQPRQIQHKDKRTGPRMDIVFDKGVGFGRCFGAGRAQAQLSAVQGLCVRCDRRTQDQAYDQPLGILDRKSVKPRVKRQPQGPCGAGLRCPGAAVPGGGAVAGYGELATIIRWKPEFDTLASLLTARAGCPLNASVSRSFRQISIQSGPSSRETRQSQPGPARVPHDRPHPGGHPAVAFAPGGMMTCAASDRAHAQGSRGMTDRVGAFCPGGGVQTEPARLNGPD